MRIGTVSLKAISLAIVLSLIASSLVVSAAAGPLGAGGDSGSSEREPFLSTPFEIYGNAGTSIGQNAMHGNNQTRVVYTETGTYIGTMTGKTSLKDSSVGVEFSLIRVKDGTSEVLYTDYMYGGSATVSVMADQRGDIWLYTGWNQVPMFYMNVYHYVVSENVTRTYTLGVNEPLKSGFGYSVAGIDPENDLIWAFMPGEGELAMAMATFNINTREWSPMTFLKTPYRSCYLYIVPDGEGGCIVVGERDVGLGDVICDEGTTVKRAFQQYKNRFENSEYCWDELYIYHIKTPTDTAWDKYDVQLATFDVKNGLYPFINNNNGDVLIDKNGLLHVFYVARDDAVIGLAHHVRQKVFDIRNGFKVVYDAEYPLLDGIGSEASRRLFEDTEGNLWLFTSHQYNNQMYVGAWLANDEIGGDFRLVGFQAVENTDANFGHPFIIANSRNNSTPSDVAHLIVGYQGWPYSYYTLEIDTAAILRNLAK